jgi:tripartite-type tricarboxylate transporter receptor subunit TctC
MPWSCPASARVATALTLAATALMGSQERLDPVAQFYRGKTVNLIMAPHVGGGYDAFGRLPARQLGKVTPGNPAVIRQNTPGGQQQAAPVPLQSGG